jgi:dihydrofolate reductase
MPKTVYYAAASLDGFIADADDSLSWLFVQEQDRNGFLCYDTFFAGIGALVMGRTTYEWLRSHSAEVTAETGSAWPYDIPTWVLTSRSLSGVEGADVRFASGDVRTVHADMLAAAEGRDLWVVGGGDLAGQFADAGLLDEVITYIAPVTLGTGRPVLPRRLALRLIETGRNGAFVCSRHKVVGPGTW